MPFTEKVTATKAWIGAIAGALTGALTALSAALADGAVTSSEWVTVVLALLAGSGVVGGAVYAAPANKPKV